MSEWKRVRLGEICLRVFSGGTPSKSNSAFYENGDIPWLNTGEVKFQDIYSTENYITQAGYDKSAAKWVEPNSIIIAMYGATAGKSCITRIRLTTNQACCNLHVNDKVADYRFVYYTVYLNYLGLASLAKGGAQQNLNAQMIKDYEIALPPLPTQRRIAAILSDYDAAIANCRKQIALLEEAAMRLYREWFGDGKGEKKTIGDVCTKIGSGGTPNRRNEVFWQNGDVPWVKTGELQDCWIFETEEKITADGLAGSSAKMFPAETVMMAIYASPTLGRLGILDAPACCNQATLCLVADEAVVSWQWLYCKLFELREEFNAIARGAGQQNISGVVVKTYNIVVPAYDKVKAFTSIVSPMFSETRFLGKQIRTLTEARDRLLPKLMSGEVAV